MESSCLIWITLVSMPAYGVSEYICPEIAEYGNSAQTTCVFAGPIDVGYASQKGPVASCIKDECTNFGRPRYNVTYINANESSLEIKNISNHDEGIWICTATQVYNCNLVIRKTPTCHITSGIDTSSLDIHENISLSVNITDYYCSTPIDFLLRAGHTEEDLLKNHTMDKTITSGVFNSTFNVTESHIGSVELIFTCNDVRKTVECDGVQTLKKRPPPQCNITASRDAGLNVGEELTMSVYIEDYSCSRSLEFCLRTGGEKDRLNVTGIYHETITFKVKESHFGPVYLEMNCNHVRRNLPCDGIKELTKGQQTTTSTLLCGECKDQTITIIAGTVAAVVVLIAVGILIAYCAKVRQKSSTDQSAFVPYGDVCDKVNTRSYETGAYSEINEINGSLAIKGNDKVSKPEMQMVPNVGYESVDDVRKGLSQSDASGLPQTEPTFTPEVEYSKVNKHRMSQNTAEV